MDFRLETDTILCIKSSASPVITRQRAGDRRGKHRQPLELDDPAMEVWRKQTMDKKSSSSEVKQLVEVQKWAKHQESVLEKSSNQLDEKIRKYRKDKLEQQVLLHSFSEQRAQLTEKRKAVEVQLESTQHCILDVELGKVESLLQSAGSNPSQNMQESLSSYQKAIESLERSIQHATRQTQNLEQ